MKSNILGAAKYFSPIFFKLNLQLKRTTHSETSLILQCNLKTLKNIV
jgi:hypothetical protein